MERFIADIFKEIVHSKVQTSDSLKKFLFNNLSNIIIACYLGSKKKATLEEICYNIPSKVISRSSVQNILKKGTKILFFEKEINYKDKRSKHYKLTPMAEKLIYNLIKSKKENLEKIKKLEKVA